jgi:hemin uptake protein HemP
MPDETHPNPHSSDDSTPAMPESMKGFPELPKIIKFDALARCGDEVWIEHNGQIYRLRKTRQEKLILTK